MSRLFAGLLLLTFPVLCSPAGGAIILSADFEASATGTGSFNAATLDSGTIGGNWTVGAAEESQVRSEGGNKALNLDRGPYNLDLDFDSAAPLDILTLSYDSYIQRTIANPNAKKNFLIGKDSDGDEVFKLVLTTDGTNSASKGRLRYVDSGGNEHDVIDSLRAENGNGFDSSDLQSFRLEFKAADYDIYVKDVFRVTAPYRNAVGSGAGQIDNLDKLSFVGSGTGGGSDSGVFYDNIAVSQTVPEPSSLVLWSALGIMGLAGSRRRKRKAAPAA